MIDPFSENQINSCQKVSQLAMDVPVVCHNRAESIWLRNRCWISDRAILLNFWTIPMVSAGRVFFFGTHPNSLSTVRAWLFFKEEDSSPQLFVSWDE